MPNFHLDRRRTGLSQILSQRPMNNLATSPNLPDLLASQSNRRNTHVWSPRPRSYAVHSHGRRIRGAVACTHRGASKRARLDRAADRTGSCVPAKDTHDHSCSLDPQALPLTRLSRSAPAFSAPFMMVDEPASKVSDPTPSPAPAEQKGFDWTQYVCWLFITLRSSYMWRYLTPFRPHASQV